MTIFKHELRLTKTQWIIWTFVIAFFMIICIILYPSMKEQMAEISGAFASMGSFSQAFGLDKINFGSLMGYYGVECGNVLGLGGAFFAAIIGVSIVAKEEKEHTAEFLLSHPIKRQKVLLEKFLVVITQIVFLNAIVFILSLLSLFFLKEEVNYQQFSLLHIAYLLMQIEIGCICFGISSFVSRGNLGIGLGIAAISYFINIIANLMTSLKWVKYFTPFGYCEGADIITNNSLSFSYILSGYLFAIIIVIVAFVSYQKRDIRS